ncbi:MAG: hypothetical protein NVSMB57_00170 [Actinomycetota bacterium]
MQSTVGGLVVLLVALLGACALFGYQRALTARTRLLSAERSRLHGAYARITDLETQLEQRDAGSTVPEIFSSVNAINAERIALEIRAPLAVVLASTRALAAEQDGKEDRSAALAASAARNASQMGRMLDTLLKSKDPTLTQKEIVDVGCILDEVAEHLGQGANVHVICEETLMAIVDSQRLRSALEQLAARVAGRRGGTIQARRTGDRIEISFRDTGPVAAATDPRQGLDVVDYLLAGSGAHMGVDLSRGDTVVSMPAIEPSSMDIRARWEASATA